MGKTSLRKLTPTASTGGIATVAAPVVQQQTQSVPVEVVQQAVPTAARTAVAEQQQSVAKESQTAAVIPYAGQENGIIPSTMMTDRGDINASDFRLPRVNLVHAIGKLFTEKKLIPGEFYLNQSVHLTKPWLTVVLGIKKYYSEKADAYVEGNIGARFATAKQAAEAGFTTDYKVHKANRAIPLAVAIADLTILVEKPDGANDVEFPFETEDGSRFALAKFTVKGMAYDVATTVFTSEVNQLRVGGLKSGVWEVVSTQKPSPAGLVWVPNFRLVDTTPDSIMKLIDNLISGGKTKDE